MPLVSSQGFEKVLFEAESEDVTITTNANYLIIEIAGFFENDDIDAFYFDVPTLELQKIMDKNQYEYYFA